LTDEQTIVTNETDIHTYVHGSDTNRQQTHKPGWIEW